MPDEPDTTQTETTQTETSTATPDAPSAVAEETTPPRKAPRRRATKASAAPVSEAPAAEAPAAEAPAAEATGAEAPASADPVAADEAAADKPAKRARKAPAKKAAPRKRVAKTAEPVEESPLVPKGELALDGAAVVAPVDEAPVEETAPDETQAAEAPADEAPEPAVEPELPIERPATRTRRRPAATVTFQAPEVVPAPAADVAEPVADEEPAAEAPRRRRRAGTAGAVAPASLVPTMIEPELVPAADDEDDDADKPAPRSRSRRRSSTADRAPQGETDEADESAESEDDDDETGERPRRRRRGRRGRGPRPEGSEDETTASEGDDVTESTDDSDDEGDDSEATGEGGTRRRRRRRRSGGGGAGAGDEDDVPTVTHVREAREPREPREPRERSQRVRGASAADEDGVRGITGSTRMAAKRARRQEGRDSGRRRPPVLSEAEFLARREAVERTMVVRQNGERTQIAVLEDGVLVEHYVTKASAQSYAGNVYLGRVQNVLPSMEAAFVDIGKGKNGVLYAGEVNYELAGSGPRKIESVLKSGQEVLVQVSKDPIGHKGARLTGAVSLPGRYLVYVPEGSMTGISRKLPEGERTRLKSILKKVVPDDAGVIIRTAAEGASEDELNADVHRLQHQWEGIRDKAAKGGAPKLLHAEPDLVVRVVRDVFNEDFTSLVVQGDSEWETIREYVDSVAPDLAPRLSRHTAETDVFTEHRIDEQLAKALDRKVWLPSGGSLVIDRTEAMIVIDVNTGKYVGKGGNLEETVTRNNLEAAEEIARQLRLRDLGGIIVVDFIDMVLESNRDLVVRRLVECLGRDRTKHQVAEVTSLGLVQMTRKRVGQGLLESFSETCEACNGRGVIVSSAPIDRKPEKDFDDRDEERGKGRGRRRGAASAPVEALKVPPVDPAAARAAAAAVAAIAKASALTKDEDDDEGDHGDGERADAPLVGETASADETQLDAKADDTAESAESAAEEAAPRPRNRRRRGGRGVGAPAAEAELTEANPVDPVDPVDPADLAEQDVPAAAPEVEVPAEAPEADVVEQAQPIQDEAPAAEVEAPVEADEADVAEQAQAIDEPAPEPVLETPAAPRRRRRATSPAGPAAT